jgi:acylphosphatase
MKVCEIKVTGRVQGVGFRYFTQAAALELKLSGWVRNQPDGSVLVRVAGESAVLARFEEKLRAGPAFARVDELRIEDLPEHSEADFHEFQIRY